MRTHFEIEEADEYRAARELLLRRCERWAEAEGLAFSPRLAAGLLDSRHFSADGRLGYWSQRQVRRALLSWIPEQVAAPEEELLRATDTLRTLLRYLCAHGLRDPRAATVKENDATIDELAAEFAAALRDEGRYGMAKAIAMSALRKGIDVSDPAAVTAFFDEVRSGRGMSSLDVLMRSVSRPASEEPRTFSQLPVCLPPAAELRDAAEDNRVVAQLRALAEWTGPQGKALTAAGHIRPADAVELVALLDTGEEHVTFRSASELPGLDFVVTLARKARLVRRQGNRMVQVAKAGPLLADAEALWQCAFDILFDNDVAAAVCPAIWPDEPATPVRHLYDLVVPDLLATVYSMMPSIPVTRMAESVWTMVSEHIDIESRSLIRQIGARGRMEEDVAHIFDAFEALGAVTSVTAIADEIFLADLADGAAEQPYSRARSRALRERLAEPGRLVSLTPLGTRAMRDRLLAEGRNVPLVGELVDASAAELLGVIAEHYTPDTGIEEIALWRAARGASAASLEQFVQAVRDCTFVTRRLAMLDVLSFALPEWPELAADLIRDLELGPYILLMQRSEAEPGDAEPTEALLFMTGSMLELLETGGPAAVLATLDSLPRSQRKDVVRAIAETPLSARETLRDFSELIAEQASARAVASATRIAGGRPEPRVVRNQHPARSRRKGRRR